MTKTPHLRETIILAILSFACWVLADQVIEVRWQQMFLLGVALSLVCGAGVTGVNWAIYIYIQRTKDFAVAQSAGEVGLIQSRLSLVRTIQALNPEQLDAIGKYQPIIGIIPGTPRPLVRLEIPGFMVPWDFVEDFLDRSSQVNLAEVRQWSEGTWRREAAQAFTAYLVTNGYAAPASGNRPASWINREGALASMYYGVISKAYHESD